MGKNWKGKGGGGGGGSSNDLTNCRGYAAVIGTCDAAREKESNKELSNLLNQAIERLYPKAAVKDEHEDRPAEIEESVADMLQNELKSLRKQKHSGEQDVVTVNVGIKGIVFAKIARRDICPVRLIKDIMDRVKADKVPCSRHLVKLVPLQLVYFGGETEFIQSAKLLAEGVFGNGSGLTLAQLALTKVAQKRKHSDIDPAPSGDQDEIEKNIDKEDEAVADEEESGAKRIRVGELRSNRLSVENNETVASSATIQPESGQETNAQAAPVVRPEVRYFVLFKARNHNTLNKTMAIQRVREALPAHLKSDYMHGQNAVIVEALKSIAGISYFPDYYSYGDLNLRKHQAEHCPQVGSSMLTASAGSGANKIISLAEGGTGPQLTASNVVGAGGDGKGEEEPPQDGDGADSDASSDADEED